MIMKLKLISLIHTLLHPGDKDISINLNKIEEPGNINIEEKGINKLLAGLKLNKASGLIL